MGEFVLLGTLDDILETFWLSQLLGVQMLLLVSR